MSGEQNGDRHDEESPSSPEIHFEPIVTLAKVDIKTLEENEEEIIKLRAKLFRYIVGQHDTAPEWKERGIGDVKILKSREKAAYRLVMRREKTLKVCANHFLNKDMELKPNCGSDRAWVWNVSADYADEEPRKETLAIRFANAENAKKFKEAFDKCKEKLTSNKCDVESEKLANELESLKVNDVTAKGETDEDQEHKETDKDDQETDKDYQQAESTQDNTEGETSETKNDTDTTTPSDKTQESSPTESKEEGQ